MAASVGAKRNRAVYRLTSSSINNVLPVGRPTTPGLVCRRTHLGNPDAQHDRPGMLPSVGIQASSPRRHSPDPVSGAGQHRRITLFLATTFWRTLLLNPDVAGTPGATIPAITFRRSRRTPTANSTSSPATSCYRHRPPCIRTPPPTVVGLFNIRR